MEKQFINQKIDKLIKVIKYSEKKIMSDKQCGKLNTNYLFSFFI